jgi:[ribosomal protein S5]-alanine N-acetyltransferase
MLGPTLVGRSVALGALYPEHLGDYCRWFADPEVTRYLPRDSPPSLREEQEWFDRIVASRTEVVWALFADGQHIGSIALSQIDWRDRRALTGILIGEKSWWGRGVATEAMQLRTRYAFEELGLEKLITNVDEDNEASRRALERVGYRTVGVYRRHHFRRGTWADVWIGELLRADWAATRSSDLATTR